MSEINPGVWDGLTPEQVRKAFADARSSGKRTILLRVKSGDNTRFFAVPVARG